jgi:hypothetical protein
VQVHLGDEVAIRVHGFVGGLDKDLQLIAHGFIALSTTTATLTV